MKRLFSWVLVVIMVLSTSTVFAQDFLYRGMYDTEDTTISIAFEGFEENTPHDHNPSEYFTYKESFLFGNGGFDHTDGIGEEVAVGMVWSMITDNDDNVWFIDQDASYLGVGRKSKSYTGTEWAYYHERTNYKGQYLRKYDSTTGEVTTIKDLNTIQLRYTDSDGVRHNLKGLRAYKLVNNPHNGKIYLSGKFTQDGDKDIYMGVMFEVSPNFKAIIGNYLYDRIAGATDFILGTEDGKFIYSNRTTNMYYVYLIGEGGEEKYEDHDVYKIHYRGSAEYYALDTAFLEGYDHMEAIDTEDFIYVCRYNPVNTDTTLVQYNKSTKKWTEIKKVVGANTSILATKDGFILHKDNAYNKIHFNGNLELLTDSSNYTVEGEKLVPTLMTELSDGSLIVYNQVKAKFSKITRYGDAPVIEEVEEIVEETPAEYIDVAW